MLTTVRINNSSCAHSLEIHAGKIGLLCLIVTAVWLSLSTCLFCGLGRFFSPGQLSAEALIAAQVITGCLFLSSVIDAIYYLYLFKKRSIHPSPPLPSLASSQTSSSQSSTSQILPISQTSHPVPVPVLDFSNKSIPKIIGYGASSLKNRDISIKGYAYDGASAEFLLCSKNPQHLFTRKGIPDQVKAATPIQPIKKFPYIISHHLPLHIKNKNITSKQFINSLVSDFFQGMRNSEGKHADEQTTLPGTLIFPIWAPGEHTYLIFVERDEKGFFHISLIDSPGSTVTTNAYCEQDVREGVEEALRMHFGHEIGVHFHYGPDQNNLMRCSIHLQMNIAAATLWILSTGRKVFEAIPTIFKKRSDSELVEYFNKDRELARQFCQKYESRKAEWEEGGYFLIDDINSHLLKYSP